MQQFFGHPGQQIGRIDKIHGPAVDHGKRQLPHLDPLITFGQPLQIAIQRMIHVNEVHVTFNGWRLIDIHLAGFDRTTVIPGSQIHFGPRQGRVDCWDGTRAVPCVRNRHTGSRQTPSEKQHQKTEVHLSRLILHVHNALPSLTFRHAVNVRIPRLDLCVHAA